jgi:hypothetical protein
LWGTGVWGGSDTATEAQLAGVAPEDDGRRPYNWSVNKRGRFIRFRFRSSAPAAKLVIRNLELFTRVSGRL